MLGLKRRPPSSRVAGAGRGADTLAYPTGGTGIGRRDTTVPVIEALLDQRLPDEFGSTIVHSLRERPQYRDIRAVVRPESRLGEGVSARLTGERSADDGRAMPLAAMLGMESALFVVSATMAAMTAPTKPRPMTTTAIQIQTMRGDEKTVMLAVCVPGSMLLRAM
mgnify:CR=1 FL=1